MVCGVVSGFIFQCVFSCQFMSIGLNQVLLTMQLFLLSKRNASLLMFSPFLLLNRSRIGRLLWFFASQKSLGIFRTSPKKPGHQPLKLVTLVFQESLGFPHLNPLALTIHKIIPSTHRLIRPKTCIFGRKFFQRCWDDSRPLTGWNTYQLLNFCSVPKQLGKS